MVLRLLERGYVMHWAKRRKLSERGQALLWLLPLLLLGVGIAGAVGMMRLDRAHRWTLLDFSAGGAQAFLGALSAALVSLLGLVFSVITLAIQFAAGNLSPRLVQPLLGGRSGRIILGIAALTLSYSLSLLLRIEDQFVPQAAVLLSLPLMVVSIAGFVMLIDSVGRELRFANIYSKTSNAGLRAIRAIFPAPFTPSGENGPARGGPLERATRVIFYSGESGIIHDIDGARLVAEARRVNGAIVLLRAIGDHIYPGIPLYRVCEGAPSVREALLRRSVHVGRERSLERDPGYAIRLLVDIAERALSPAVNDPTTAVGCLDRLELLLHELGHRNLGAGHLADDDGTVRVRIPAPSWRDYVRLACDEIRFYGIESFQVTRRLKAMLEDLTAALPEPRGEPLAEQLEILEREIRRHLVDEADARRAGTADRQGLGVPTETSWGGPRPGLSPARPSG